MRVVYTGRAEGREGTGEKGRGRGNDTSWPALIEQFGRAEQVRHARVQLRREGAAPELHPPREVLVRELAREWPRRREDHVLEDCSYHLAAVAG